MNDKNSIIQKLLNESLICIKESFIIIFFKTLNVFIKTPLLISFIALKFVAIFSNNFSVININFSRWNIILIVIIINYIR